MVIQLTQAPSTMTLMGRLVAFVTAAERGYGSTWTHLLEDWSVSHTLSLRRTSHLARVYADTPLHFYPLRGFVCYFFLLLRHKNPYTDTTIFRI